MPLKALSILSTKQYSKQLLQFLKGWENAPLIGDTHSLDGAIHDDSTHIPTVGYGLNLLAISTDDIAKAFTYALTGSTTGQTTTQQQTGIAIVTQWRQNASSATLSANLDMIAKSRGSAGSNAEKTALESIWLSDNQASRLLEAKLFGGTDLFGTSIEDQVAARLASYGASMPRDSVEKLVLMSLFYNAPGLIGPGISDAIATNNHAKFWYEVRYNHANTGFRGVQNRREDESDKVGILAPDDRNSAAKILDALATLFDRDSGIYDRIVERDQIIKASDPGEYATQSFAAQVSPYLKTLSVKLANGRDIDFVQSGGGGRDKLFPEKATHDGLTAGKTSDLLVGLGGRDKLKAGGGKDVLLGGKGDDLLHGGRGNDLIKAGSGDDRIIGGNGSDKLEGNAGRDVFVFNSKSGRDTIRDFEDGLDRLDLAAFSFSSKAAALAHFHTSGPFTVFEFANAEIRLKGVQIANIDGNDILI